MSRMSDMVITGARVWTGVGTGERPRPATIHVRGGRVVGLDYAAGPRIGDLHLPGRVIVPGFQDAHVHPGFAGRFLAQLWLHPLARVPAYLSAVGDYADTHPDVEWVFGSGWEMEHFHPGYPTRDLLDDVVPDRPVFLFNASLHEAWVNTRALEVAGLSGSTPDPVDGRYGRSGGELTGHLVEGAAHRFEARFVPPPSIDDWRSYLLRAQEHLLALGITGWQDAWVTPPLLAAYRSLADAGALEARVVAALWWERDRGLEQIAGFEAARDASRADQLLVRTVKIMVDGVVENGSAGLLAPYHDGCGRRQAHRGSTYVPPEVLEPAVTELDRLGFQVHLHTLGDGAVRIGLDALAAARRANGDLGNRHTLAHLQVVDPDDLDRFGPLGAVPNCQTYWAQSEPAMDELTIPFLGAARAQLQYPFASLARTGARLAMGSDWPVSTADPLRQIEVAVHRTDPARRGAPAFLPAERLTVEQALHGFTSGAAWVNHDDDAGVILPGARADLAVLDGDPFEGYPGDVGVELTLIGGRVVFRRR
jgi:predicted amidohydrolase YtcJ